MIHNSVPAPTGEDQHWAVSTNGRRSVLAQLQDIHADQARVMLTPEAAREMARALLAAAEKAESEESVN